MIWRAAALCLALVSCGPPAIPPIAAGIIEDQGPHRVPDIDFELWDERVRTLVAKDVSVFEARLLREGFQISNADAHTSNSRQAVFVYRRGGCWAELVVYWDVGDGGVVQNVGPGVREGCDRF